MVKALQIESDNWAIFEDRSATLIRIMMTIITLLLISAETIDKDQFNYRRRIKLFLLIICISEIISYILQLHYHFGVQRWIRKIGVELIFIILNCSVIYHMNKFLGNSPSTLSRIFYGSTIIVVFTCILPHSKYGRLTYAANCIVSSYSLMVLHRLKSYFYDLSISSFKLFTVIPVAHIALFRLEIVIFILNFIVYSVSFYYGDIPYPGWHVIHQFSAFICLMYLVKIYIVVVEWRGHNSVNKTDDTQYAYKTKDVEDDSKIPNNVKKENNKKEISTNISVYDFKK